MVSVALHDPLAPPASATAAPLFARLLDAAEGSATADRSFRIVFDAERGCATATQFVGYVPVGAAPRHYHRYEEVIYILDGDGVMHMNGGTTPLRAGSCIHLPPETVHTLENSGPGVMRLLGAFRPAGSPAAAFYPDGTPAETADEPQTAATAK
jgi:mannose-6-phosphate isomerase-like protein (cupin superfamily)